MPRPVAVQLDPEVHARVRRLAEAQNQSTDDLMRAAITQYVEREEKRATFRHDAMAAWSAYQADGLHVTQAEADDWLAQLEAGGDGEPPECHS